MSDFFKTTHSLIADQPKICSVLKSIYGEDFSISTDTFVGVNLAWPDFDLPLNYRRYVISFHTEYLDIDWIIKQATRIYPKHMLLISDFDIKSGFPWPDNIKFSQYVSLSQQLKVSIERSGIIPVNEISNPKYKISSLSFRISQSKKFVTAYLLKYFPHDYMILSYHNHLGKAEDHHGYPGHYTVFNNLNLDRLDKSLINMPDDSDTINISPVDNVCWKTTAYQNALINFTNESYHYSGSERHGKSFQHPGPYITEKTFKPLLAGRPFLPVGQAQTVDFLQNLGLSLDFGFDLSYDSVIGDLDRMLKLFDTIDQINQTDLDCLYESSISAVTHNINHILSGDLERQCKSINWPCVNLLLNTL